MPFRVSLSFVGQLEATSCDVAQADDRVVCAEPGSLISLTIAP